IAVEYEPAYSGELNPAVESVIVHLFKRGSRVITVSSSPAGAGLAQMMLAQAAGEVGEKQEGTHYLNLGYIPGGVIGLQQFASDPTGTIQSDFTGVPDPFKRDVLSGFASIDQFSMIIVASGAPEQVQGWIEQVQVRPTMQGKMAAITSAAAEPLLKPYTTGDSPAISAMLSGFGGAAQYDLASQRKTGGQWAASWLSFGFGLMAGAGVLTLGAAWSVFAVLTSKKPATARASARAAARAASVAVPVAAAATVVVAEEAPRPQKAKSAKAAKRKVKTPAKAKRGKSSGPVPSARPRMRKV
ncbi:MAG TPA: hypothetical protein VJ020_00060, partial [Anaerolineales bacterium]|nr:hypothetical protein [Anaerolineales bacterium]